MLMVNSTEKAASVSSCCIASFVKLKWPLSKRM